MHNTPSAILLHAGSTRVPVSYTNAAGSAERFSFDSAFWVFNMVANFAYYRWEQVAPVVDKYIRQYEQQFAQEVAANDAAALDLWASNRTAAAIELLTAAGVKRGNDLVSAWLQLYQELFVLFRDGSTPRNEVHGVEVPAGYAQDWYDRVAKDTGGRYLMPAMDNANVALNEKKLKVLRKNRV